MAVSAAKKALDEAGVLPEELDLIIAATLSPDHVLPTLSCEVQAALGASRAVAFDLHAACSGFLFSMNTAAAYLKCGIYKNALILGAETLSKMLDWTDRGTCVLFGDGAGAALLRELPDDGSGAGLKSFAQYSDGGRGDALACNGRPVRHPFAEHTVENQFVTMDGQAVYKFAVSTVPNIVREAVEAAGMSLDEIDCFVLHQANQRIIESVAKRLKQPMEKFPMNLQECGNISAASVPILLDSLNKNGMIKQGDKVVLAGFGAGLTWGAAVIQW
jgi:3-oxoacyl-[acyl-carrier-protein] synthase-3